MKLSQVCSAGLPRSACEIYFSSISLLVRISVVIIRSSRTKTGIGTSQNSVIVVTASELGKIQNASGEGYMPILILALVALAAFGLIGVMLALAVTFELKKVNGRPRGAGKAA